MDSRASFTTAVNPPSYEECTKTYRLEPSNKDKKIENPTGQWCTTLNILEDTKAVGNYSRTTFITNGGD